MKVINLVNEKFGRLTVLEQCGVSKDGQKLYLCKCDCGNTKKIRSGNLRSGHCTSCGCINRERIIERNKNSKIHGGCGTRLYRIWFDMRQRCSYKKAINWHLYGGRGIKVCGEWKNDFATFKKWADKNGYDENKTLDRINNNGNYEPQNCRWATRAEQDNNKRTCIYVTIDGITKSVTEWCRITGVNRHTAYSRIYKGWEPERAVKEPAKKAVKLDD